MATLNSAPSFIIGDGQLITDFGYGSNDYGYSAAIQADGKILVAGSSRTHYSNYNFNYNFALARYNPDGTLDTSFDSDGMATTDFGNYDQAYSVAVQADGKILVAGSSETYPNGDFALARYNPDGTLDTTFSGDGKVTTNFGSSARGYSVTVQGDGQILVAGFSGGNFALARYNPDGSLDTTFDGDGKLATDFGYLDYYYGYSVVVQADGKLLVAGSNGDDFVLMRYNPDGSLDTTFSGDGTLTTDLRTYDRGQSVTVQADGQILVAGSRSLSDLGSDEVT
jgi:uncharacterized delta-60 repeat protein